MGEEELAYQLSIVFQLLKWAAGAAILGVMLYRRRWYTRWAQGLGAALSLSLIPALWVGADVLDITALMPAGLSLPAEPVRWALKLLGIMACVYWSWHNGLKAELAQQLARGRAFPLLRGGGGPRYGGWLIGAVAGAIGAVLTLVFFQLLGVQVGSGVEALTEMAPGLEEVNPVLLGVVQVLAVVALAAEEELMFRGVVQPALARFGDRLLPDRQRVTFWAAVITVSALFAIGHAGNATPITPKLVQTFLLGVGFGWLTERYSLEAAMVSHVVHNLTAVGVAWVADLMGWLPEM